MRRKRIRERDSREDLRGCDLGVDRAGRETGGSRAMLARLRLSVSPAANRLRHVPVLGALLHRIVAFLIPRGTLVWARIESGPARDFWILVDVRGGSDFVTGNREPEVQRILDQWLVPGKVFYDIGANAGYFCLTASKLVGESGRIFAFEAEPDVASRLRKTIERNRLTSAMVVEKAIWRESGAVSFDRGLGSPDRLVGHITSGQVRESTGLVTVPAISLDDFARNAPPPDVIKCDVEGAELEVFRGATNLLTTRRPKVICEVHSPENLQELRSIFRQNGYHAELLDSQAQFPVHIAAEATP